MEDTYQADFAGAGLLFYLFQADADPDHKDCGRRTMRLTDRDLRPLTRRSSRQAPISSKVTTPSVDGEHDLRAILEGYLGADGYTTATADIEAAALAADRLLVPRSIRQFALSRRATPDTVESLSIRRVL